MPIPLAAIPIAAQAISGIGKGIAGLFGRKKAREDFNNVEMPSILDSQAYQTAQTSENLAQRFAQEGLPEQTMRFQEDMIGRAGAAALASQGTLRGLTQGGGVAQSLLDQTRQLAAMDAQQRIANRGEWFRQRQNVQGLETMQAEREYGQAVNKQAEALARMTANQQNVQSGLNALYGAGSMAFSAGMTPTEYGGFLGGGNVSNQAQGFGQGQDFGIPQGSMTSDSYAGAGLYGGGQFSRSFMNPAFATVIAPPNPF